MYHYDYAIKEKSGKINNSCQHFDFDIYDTLNLKCISVINNCIQKTNFEQISVT